jgi:hypothetical protein
MIEFLVYFVGIATVILVVIEALKALFFRGNEEKEAAMPEYFMLKSDDIGVWQAKGIKIIGFPNVVEPPIHFKGEAFSDIYEHGNTVCLELVYPNYSVSIFVDKEELEGDSKDEIIFYLLKRKILVL